MWRCCSISQPVYWLPKCYCKISATPGTKLFSHSNWPHLANVYGWGVCHRSHQAMEMLICLLYLGLLWEACIWAYCWVNMTVRIMETMHSEEKQRCFSNCKVNSRQIVSIQVGAHRPTEEVLSVKSGISKQSWCFLLGVGCCQGFRGATPVSTQETKQDILV